MSLVAGISVRLGPLVIATLIRHFLEKKSITQLSKARDELLFDQAFVILKTFLHASTKHTIEELQQFSNTSIPSPPWVHNVRVLIPLVCCDEAAQCLITALGGEEAAKRVVGGTKWWQVRGLRGVDAQWVATKKDWKQVKKSTKMERSRNMDTNAEVGVEETLRQAINDTERKEEPQAEYSPEMDHLRCMLYIHGGGYFFGSTDQQRYCIERYARKMNGRVLSVNYRLSPQYPFPCAIQDCVAAYLYLIRPPPDADHTPVPPSQIIIAGDSAGGGIALGVLQVIRDSGLPLPAGGVLISPWSDLMHSFPSSYENAKTDIIPDYGLSMYKPSTLWPPPADEFSVGVRRRLTARVQSTIRRGSRFYAETVTSETTQETEITMSPVPEGIRRNDVTAMVDGKPVTVQSQMQLYALNHQLTHPFVSPVLAYLGGLPPLHIIASDKERLRDEIVYLAHRAAHPDRYPIKPETKKLYPLMDGIEARYGPTDVHLQVYDETCHVLPLFSFTTPAKYCYRAIAQFCRHVTTKGRAPPPIIVPESPLRGSSIEASTPVLVQSPQAMGDSALAESPASSIYLPEAGEPSVLDRHRSEPAGGTTHFSTPSASLLSPPQCASPEANVSESDLPRARRRSRLGSPSAFITSFRQSVFGDQNQPRGKSLPLLDTAAGGGSGDSEQVAGPRFNSEQLPAGAGTAGHPDVYKHPAGGSPFKDHMIRERISTRGVIRELEPEEKLVACQWPLERVGAPSEAVVAKFMEGKAKWDKKYSKEAKDIARKRKRNIELAKKELPKMMSRLETSLLGSEGPSENGKGKGREECKVLGEPSWNWAWVLDGEVPPPSSIVARCDTDEARALSKIADSWLGQDDTSRMSGNNLWSLAVDFLTAGPDDKKKNEESDEGSSSHNSHSTHEGALTDGELVARTPAKSSSFLKRFRSVKH